MRYKNLFMKTHMTDLHQAEGWNEVNASGTQGMIHQKTGNKITVMYGAFIHGMNFREANN